MLAPWKGSRAVDRLTAFAVSAMLLAGVDPSAGATVEEFADARAQMVVDIRANADSVGTVGGRTGISESVLHVMGQIPRHEFLPRSEWSNAYQDRPLPIGYGQTISQPYIVALMTELLEVSPDDVVLEVGTGSGYQAAVLSPLCREVYTIEIVTALAEQAKANLKRLGFDNVTVRPGDGYYGWPEHAPFDGIIVTAAASHVPPPLIQQLRPGGRMVIPVGGPFFVQQLIMVEKAADGSVSTRHLLPVRFVPLTGGH